MFVPFNTLSGASRVWIYQVNRTLTPAEEERVDSALGAFCEQWAAHSQPLKSSFKVAYRHFVIICADESFNNASGCSIDGSVKVLKQLQDELIVNFFDRLQVAILTGGEVRCYPQKSIKDLIALGKLGPDDLTFNNLVATKADLDERWIVPISQSWLARFQNATA